MWHVSRGSKEDVKPIEDSDQWSALKAKSNKCMIDLCGMQFQLLFVKRAILTPIEYGKCEGYKTVGPHRILAVRYILIDRAFNIYRARSRDKYAGDRLVKSITAGE